jgi:hypothetical protein
MPEQVEPTIYYVTVAGLRYEVWCNWLVLAKTWTAMAYRCGDYCPMASGSGLSASQAADIAIDNLCEKVGADYV